jgi:tripartite-type tricarboxylate transporter receptor subunit TctC
LRTPLIGWLAGLWLLAAVPAQAEQWPSRPVTLICPFPPGISTDILARALGMALSESLGQQFVLENRPGANGNIGAAGAAKAAPDGYTFLVATLGPAVANKYMYKTMPFDPEKAFVPVGMIGYSPLIIVGSPKIPPTNLKELVTYAKANPGKINAGTVGHGSQAHITLELINKLGGISITHVPYRIATQALPDLMSGDLQVGFNYIPTFVPNVQDGSIRGLAVTTLKRLPELPNVPTVDEQGFPGFEATGWNTLLAPAGTPQEIVDKVNANVNAYLNSEAGKAQMHKIFMTPIGGSQAAAQAFLDRERSKWVPIIREANITLQ